LPTVSGLQLAAMGGGWGGAPKRGGRLFALGVSNTGESWRQEQFHIQTRETARIWVSGQNGQIMGAPRVGSKSGGDGVCLITLLELKENWGEWERNLRCMFNFVLY